MTNTFKEIDVKNLEKGVHLLAQDIEEQGDDRHIMFISITPESDGKREITFISSGSPALIGASCGIFRDKLLHQYMECVLEGFVDGVVNNKLKQKSIWKKNTLNQQQNELLKPKKALVIRLLQRLRLWRSY